MSASAAGLLAGLDQRLDRRRVFIFPSRAGLIFGAVLLVILLGAINYDNALGYLLAFLLAGMAMVTMLHTFHNLFGLRFVEAYAEPIFAGDNARFYCVFDNDSERDRLGLVLKRWPRRLGRAERRYHQRFETSFNLPASQVSRVGIEMESHQRGWLELDRLCLHSEYPLGILRAWAYFKTPARCLVYPRPIGKLPLPVDLADNQGRAASELPGLDEFAGLREYRPGDPVRAIAWKTLARSDQLLIKRFNGQTSTRVWLPWAAVSDLGHVEQRLSQLTAWVVSADQRGLSYGLEIPGERIEYGRGAQHRDRCLQALALFRVNA